MSQRPSTHNTVIILEAIDRALAAWEIFPPTAIHSTKLMHTFAPMASNAQRCFTCGAYRIDHGINPKKEVSNV